MPWNRSHHNVVGLLLRHFATKPKPKMKPIELNTPPEQTQTITRVIFDILKEHGPLTIAETWDRVKVLFYSPDALFFFISFLRYSGLTLTCSMIVSQSCTFRDAFISIVIRGLGLKF